MLESEIPVTIDGVPRPRVTPREGDPGVLVVEGAGFEPWLRAADLQAPLPTVSRNAARFFREGHFRHPG